MRLEFECLHERRQQVQQFAVVARRDTLDSTAANFRVHKVWSEQQQRVADVLWRRPTLC